MANGNAQAAGAAPATDPRRAIVGEFASLLEREPTHIGALYYGARVLAGMGDHETALSWLDRLEKIGLGDELDPDDFGALADTPAFRERAARFAAAAPSVGQARLVREIQAPGLLPEGTAWDPKRRELLISSGRRRTVLALDENGRTREVVPPADKRIMAVLGMCVDPSTDSLWVATSAAPFMLDVQPGEETGALLARIGLQTGRVITTHSLGGQVMLNDLTMAPDGSIYVTESIGGTIYRLGVKDDTLRVVVPAGTWEGPNGIIALATGDLLVADFHGLSLVYNPTAESPLVKRLATPDSLYLGGIDGLALAGDRVIGIQNLVGRSRIWSLSIDPVAGRVAVARLLLRGHPDFLNPTTGAVASGRFYFIADPKLQHILPGGALSPLPEGRLGYKLLSLDLDD